MGANALDLGPVFESTSHGYDTADYYTVDRRLGTNAALSNLSEEIHRRGMRLILDGVFNHVGRDFWGFKDVQQRGTNSPYRDWFLNLRFEGLSPYGDPFTYEGWGGHYNLVKINLRNPQVRDHLFGAIRMWIEEIGIDGLRLDTADLLEPDFLCGLRAFCKGLRPDFWLMGEVIHGDYNKWVNPEMLDSVTSYENHKGLYSSHVDKNYFEIAYSLNRQFGPEGIYKNLDLYAFVDNHDVDRLADCLTEPAHLFPTHILLFTMPGIPSIYYGSEFGIRGRRVDGCDDPLRPSLDLEALKRNPPQPGLAEAIARLAGIRAASLALRSGAYRQLFVAHEQFGFLREGGGERVAVVVNAAAQPALVRVDIPGTGSSRLTDLLNDEDEFRLDGGAAEVEVPPAWGRILGVA
jgi:glycosidase